MKDPKEDQWYFNNITDIGPFSVSYFDVHNFERRKTNKFDSIQYSIFCVCLIRFRNKYKQILNTENESMSLHLRHLCLRC